MDSRSIAAYDKLVPTDQLIIDAMISALYGKDLALRKCVEGVHELLERKEKPLGERP